MLDRRRKERTEELTELLERTVELGRRETRNVVAVVVGAEYRKERHAEWLPDTSFESKKFVRWICSACNHWQSATKDGMSGKIFYMNYCPFCGAQMDKPEREGE